jgi:hypothetical protein
MKGLRKELKRAKVKETTKKTPNADWTRKNGNPESADRAPEIDTRATANANLKLISTDRTGRTLGTVNLTARKMLSPQLPRTKSTQLFTKHLINNDGGTVLALCIPLVARVIP